jgi:type II secretory ATPase GspE/PulE/Tfp pilus assembly ATPase PilB-like protein
MRLIPVSSQGLGRSEVADQASRAADHAARQSPVRRAFRSEQSQGARRHQVSDQSGRRTGGGRGRQARALAGQLWRGTEDSILKTIETEDLNLEFSDDEAQNAADTAAAVDIDDAPVVKYLQKMLLDAINSGASDIHFEPYEKSYRIRYRMDGMLYEVAQPPLAIKDKIASRIKVISKLDISEKRVPQDGRMKLVLSRSKSVDFRVSTLPTIYGEKDRHAYSRFHSATMGIEKLGYEPDQLKLLLDAVQRPYGMVLVTGPTGSGKTVSLYACLNILNKPDVNISTVEDPVEIQLPGINQVNVNDKAGLDFAAAMKAFLRQDPDIIMVGEIRDHETGDIAIKAAQTGHMVLSTLHTNDAPATLTRLINMGIPSYNVAASVQLITAQRLGRKLCPQLQEADRYSAGSADQCRIQRGGSGWFLAALWCRGVRCLQTYRLQGSLGHLSGHADQRRDQSHHSQERFGCGYRRAGQTRWRAELARSGSCSKSSRVIPLSKRCWP